MNAPRPNLDEIFQKARAHVAAGDPRGALDAVRVAFEDAATLELDRDFTRALEVVGAIGAAVSDAELEAAVKEALSALDDPERAHALGYGLVERGLHDVAAGVLGRACRRHPDDARLLAELVSALERQGRHAEACNALRSAPAILEAEFVGRYLLAFNTVMAGDLATAAELLPSLGPSDDGEVAMAQRIVEMLARADATRRAGATLGPRDLRGWHFVTTGGLLLHLSPHGFEEGMNGRYAFTQDSEARCREGLERARQVLAAWGRTPARVLGLADRDSQILGRAAARLFGVPFEAYRPDAEGLVVAYDLASLDEDTPAVLFEHAPGQVLYTHACCWTDTPVCAPDLVTVLYQQQQTPWGARFRMDEGALETLPPDESSPDVIADRIVSASPLGDEDRLDADDLPGLVAFARAVRDQASAVSGAGRRSPFWDGGPVRSSRFR